MKGSNTIIVNAPTMVEAMQEYLDKRAAGGKAEEVVSVIHVFENGRPTYQFILNERKSVGAT